MQREKVEDFHAPRCMNCREEITFENNGVSLNDGELYLRDDCHLMEYGVHIMMGLLMYPVTGDCPF